VPATTHYKPRSWSTRPGFDSWAGTAIGRIADILVERARRRGAQKRGGDWQRVNWESAVQVAQEHPEELLTLDAALSRLSEKAADHAKVVELMFFAGLTGEEAAQALEVSPSTVDRRWKFARAWLHRELMTE
jgi:RNA polymerase sigma factor (TIGR02999 family)